MSRLDETLRPLAARLVARAGTAMTWRRAGPPAYDPATGAVTAAETDTAVTGVIEEVETGHPDGLVRRGDRIVTLAAEPLALEPVPGDALLIGGTVHRVVTVTTTWAGDRPALYRLHVRR
ncbi:hypothetical protein GCM10017083_07030 [Thalassobaculum fulvum]|uniref:Uncharacterized protein n=1 Tax=Thalassobaculum fulvum TaxID=1633335 RepID=A0A918XPF7_9PROT|nr:hypothetical protein [Thalassobaculum fulvum]GHD42244.1 hypothetical protein GCM10017083_07030 [Thalassobaculum fulvum]